MFSLKWKFSVCFFQHDFYTYWTFCSQDGSRLSDWEGKGVKPDWGLLGRDKRHRTLGISPSLCLPLSRLPLQRDLCLSGWAPMVLIVGGGKSGLSFMESWLHWPQEAKRSTCVGGIHLPTMSLTNSEILIRFIREIWVTCCYGHPKGDICLFQSANCYPTSEKFFVTSQLVDKKKKKKKKLYSDI